MSSSITYVDEETTLEAFQSEFLSSSDNNNNNNPPPFKLVLAIASFVRECTPLVDKLGSDVDNVDVIVIKTDASDELEELAIELGLNSIPSFQIYQGKSKVVSSQEGDKVTYESIVDALQKATAASTTSCCAPPSNGSNDSNDILRMVAKSYADTLHKEQNCCVSVDSTLNGYSAEDLIKAGADANLGLGCGNPLSFACLMPGETVVDLGSGAGIDCFLAADKVGPSGKVIGIDMTPDMIHQARSNAQKRNADVQFRLGEIEYLPVADGVVDCIISNCVINLSPDKAQVFREMFRVLKQGGRIAISDVVTRPEKIIPQELQNEQALACWVSGAPQLDNLEDYLVGAGFSKISINMKEESREVIKQWLPGSGAEDYVVSAEITASK